jgi:hypothetical protein
MADKKNTKPQVQLKQVDPPTAKDQKECEHDWTKAYHLFQGTVSEVCKKCFASKEHRSMTDEEAEEAYGKL